MLTLSQKIGTRFHVVYAATEEPSIDSLANHEHREFMFVLLCGVLSSRQGSDEMRQMLEILHGRGAFRYSQMSARAM